MSKFRVYYFKVLKKVLEYSLKSTSSTLYLKYFLKLCISSTWYFGTWNTLPYSEKYSFVIKRIDIDLSPRPSEPLTTACSIAGTTSRWLWARVLLTLHFILVLFYVLGVIRLVADTDNFTRLKTRATFRRALQRYRMSSNYVFYRSMREKNERKETAEWATMYTCFDHSVWSQRDLEDSRIELNRRWSGQSPESQDSSPAGISVVEQDRSWVIQVTDRVRFPRPQEVEH